MEPAALTTFVGAAILLLVVPGPVMMYIAARGFEQGRQGALIAVLGIQAAEVLHIAVGALGLGALIATSAPALTCIAVAGALYLLGLGIHTLLPRRDRPDRDAPAPNSGRTTFVHSAMINLLNPHTTLFYLAFLPAFVDPERGTVALQYLAFGLIFVLLGLVIEGGFAILAGSLRAAIVDTARRSRAIRLVVGSIYIAFGVGLAVNAWTW